MASTDSWRNDLNEHPIFTELKRSAGIVCAKEDSKNILTQKDGDLFIWNAADCNILTTNLKNNVLGNDRKYSFQKLLCTNAPVFEVENLAFSISGCHLALSGPQGVSVLHMPRRWGKHADFEGGKERVICKTTPIGERFFTSSSKLRILQVAWHPGSKTDTHLVVLTSDNHLRIYNITDPQNAEQTFSLGDLSPGLTTTLSSSLGIGAALGEVAVAFDFGPPVEPKKDKTNNQSGDLVWPIYILQGNGEVYSLITSVNPLKSLKSKLHGPLSMYPPAEDNYGTDACSMLCLHTTPPVLAIATCAGNLYHCIVLNKGEDDDTTSEISWSTTDESTQYGSVREDSLYVYETVELELALTTVSVGTDEIVQDSFSCPIRLHKDPCTHRRYHCSHSAGVHGVALTWINNFEKFCEDELENALHTGDQATVEHIICTRPLSTSPPSPILGLTVTTDHILGTNLMVLLSSLECEVLPLVENYKEAPPKLLSEKPSQTVTSPLRKIRKEPFDFHIKKLVERETSNPILRSSGRTELSQQQCFQILSRATQVFREEYIQKQDLAREEIQKRVKVLTEQKEQQQADIQQCQRDQEQLRESAEQLANKFEEAQEKHEEIIARTEVLLRKIESKLPILSDAEKNMNKDLKSMEEKIKQFKASLQLIRVKMNYQKQQSRQSTRQSPSPALLSKTQQEQLKQVLKEEGDQITTLVKQVKDLKVKLDV